MHMENRLLKVTIPFCNIDGRVFVLLTMTAMCFMCQDRCGYAQAIDRRALVERHAIVATAHDAQSPMSLGNGEFAYSFDITGMQTFEDSESKGVPLSTMAQWNWHRFPGSEKYRYEDTLRDYDAYGHKVSYATEMRSDTAQAYRANPHRFNLARIGFRIRDEQGRDATVGDIESPRQRLSLWHGVATSTFRFAGQPVRVRTVVHPSLDAVAVEVESPLLSDGRLAVEIGFAYPAGVWGPVVESQENPSKHFTDVKSREGGYLLVRGIDATNYEVAVNTSGSLQASDGDHCFLLRAQASERLTATFVFQQESRSMEEVPGFELVRAAAARHWEQFWRSGGAVDLSESRDERWRELERRIVLSQFLTAIHCAGSMPPQETGLMCNSWYGKSHLEMHWWHAAHFVQWNRASLLERSMSWYERSSAAARKIAQRQGYDGVRWPKMTGPDGVSSPSEVGELLIWQQPHPIFFAEQLYRSCLLQQTQGTQQPVREMLERYRGIVFQTAAFMADYAQYDKAGDRYVLGPVLIPAQECYDGRTPPGVVNPTFELAYWRWGLDRANLWRERMGLERDKKWDDVARKISRLPTRGGVYTAIENTPFTNRRDHPSMLGALGVLPDVGLVDASVMAGTLDDVLSDWDWQQTWGWDYPMMAMTAARVGRRSQAVDMLLVDTAKNCYLANGHCYQAQRLPAYLPANGGLLYAVAMMAAGWDGAEGHAPGFPNDGTWNVKHEGLSRVP
ncbi:MAG: hypothetical protein R3E01_09510 [Pirellulaceae bacterium]